ncbi:MAG: hypothetical protein ACREAY_07435 [Nitrososphaera sp.]|uniref:hypothetical protein n=1 Tax=Nitrososphaera sp. TaxID=1971748 RepID=UPI003D6F2657
MSDLEKTVQDLEKRLLRLEQAFYGKKEKAATGFEQALVGKIDEIGTQDLILLALLQRPKQTKAEIRAVLADWGKAFGTWFDGGNFSGRLVKSGLVKKDGENDKGEDVFALSKKGEMEADALAKKI